MTNTQLSQLASLIYCTSPQITGVTHVMSHLPQECNLDMKGKYVSIGTSCCDTYLEVIK